MQVVAGVEQVGRACRSRYGGIDRLGTCMGLRQSRVGVGRSDGGDVGELGLADNLAYGCVAMAGVISGHGRL